MRFSIIKTIEKKAMTVVIHPLSMVTTPPPPLDMYLGVGENRLL